MVVIVLTKKIRWAALSAAAVLTLSACGGGANASGVKAGEVKENGDALASAAAEEGALSFYCSAAPDTCEGLAKGFEKEHPDVDVTVLRATSTDVSARYASEKKARAKTADVVLNSDITFIASALEEELVVSFEDAGYLPDGYPSEWLIEHDAIQGTPFLSEAVGIAVNTKQVPAAERPKSWSDLTDPKWKGKMNGPDKESASFAPMYGTVGDHVDGFVDGLSKQDIFGDSGGMVSLTEALGAGEYAVQSLASPIIVGQAKEKGAPVDIIYPEPGLTGPAWGYTLNPEPAHPAAQKAFAEYVTSEKVAQVLSGIADVLLTAHVEPDFEYFPPNWEYYAEEGEKEIVDRMSGK